MPVIRSLGFLVSLDLADNWTYGSATGHSISSPSALCLMVELQSFLGRWRVFEVS